MSEPLRRLTRKDVPYQWGKKQDKAFNEFKKRLANTETLEYFDKDAETCLIIYPTFSKILLSMVEEKCPKTTRKLGRLSGREKHPGTKIAIL